MQYEKEELTGIVREFISIMKENNLSHLCVKNDEFELELGEKPPMPLMPPVPPMHNMPPMPPIPPMASPAGVPMAQPGAMPVPEAAGKPVGFSIKSPIIGTFYASSAPGKAPFVKVGDSVEKGQTVCIIESMKVMNEITADANGIVKEICVSDGDAVEYDQPLIILE